MNTILMMYATLIAPIVAGICNMMWCKAPILKKMQVPMDGGRNLSDGKRIFGDNKTWKGFIGYLILNTICSVVWGLVCNCAEINQYIFFYVNHDNNISYNLLIGVLLGLGYALFELPNSFIKRRMDIIPGRPPQGTKKYLFILIDQADSILGCCLVVCIFYRMSFWLYIAYVLLGAVTHIVINMILYIFKLRKNLF